VSAGAIRVRRILGAPVVALRLALGGGARREETPGQALISGRMLAEGTHRRDWRALALAAERRGMSLAGWGALEAHGLAVDALAADWPEALDLLHELLFEPAFPEERLRWVARHAAAELEAQADQADLLTARAFVDLLYSPHPMGRPLQGSAESLAVITPAACADFHARALARGGWLVIAGEVDEVRVAHTAAERFAALRAPAADDEPPPAPPAPRPARREIRTRAHDQAHLFVGQLSVARGHPDHPALELAGVAMGAGSGLSGRIPQRIRDREGLAYAASADAVSAAGLDAGRFVAYVGTSPETLERAEDGVRAELVRLVTEGLTAEEVEEARSYLLGREPFRRETARQWAELAAYGAVLGLPLEDPAWYRERLRTLDLASVNAALRRHLDPECLSVVAGLPAQG
jgi:zinc protease